MLRRIFLFCVRGWKQIDSRRSNELWNINFRAIKTRNDERWTERLRGNILGSWDSAAHRALVAEKDETDWTRLSEGARGRLAVRLENAPRNINFVLISALFVSFVAAIWKRLRYASAIFFRIRIIRWLRLKLRLGRIKNSSNSCLIDGLHYSINGSLTAVQCAVSNIHSIVDHYSWNTISRTIFYARAIILVLEINQV